MPTERIVLLPKRIYLRDAKAAADHTNYMATPQFQFAAASAIIEYSRIITNGDPALAASVTFKLRGAQEYLNVLMNLGIPDAEPVRPVNNDLTPPEEARASDLRGEF